MESFILIVLCFLALYYLSNKQDRVAYSMIGEEFDRYERRYNHITYSCHDATVVSRRFQSAVPLALVPSTAYTVKALCLTEEGHWFWFSSSIRRMKLEQTRIVPASSEEALTALKDDPEAVNRYFPNSDGQSV